MLLNVDHIIKIMLNYNYFHFSEREHCERGTSLENGVRHSVLNSNSKVN